MNKLDRKAIVKAKVVVSQGNKKYSIEKVLKRIYHKMPARLRRFLFTCQVDIQVCQYSQGGSVDNKGRGDFQQAGACHYVCRS